MRYKKGELGTLEITPGEGEYLSEMYMNLGAWTYGEGVAALGQERFNLFVREGLLGRQETIMGPVYHLMTPGRVRVFGTAERAASFSSQLDQCYTRLCLSELNWDVLEDTHPLFERLTENAPTRKFIAARTSYGTALVAGKVAAGGYSANLLKYVAQRARSQALSNSILLVFLTPSARKGEAIAARNGAFMRLHTHLPRTTDNPKTKRFYTVPKWKQSAPQPDHGPALTAASVTREKQSTERRPDLSLDVLLKNRRQRIEHAEQALMCDGVITGQQLARHYDLRPQDLSGKLATTTVTRPQGKSCRVETSVHLIVAAQRMTRLPDETLFHRVGVAEARMLSNIEPDPERWIVEPTGKPGVELPDAQYINADGEWCAVEFDAGNYSFNTIDNKLSTFKDTGYARIIYAVTSRVRQRNVAQAFAKTLTDAPLLARWWTTD